MRRWIERAGAGIGVVLAGALAAVTVGGLLWRRTTTDTIERVLAAGAGCGAETFTVEQLAGLPAPVIRYFERSLVPGQPLIGTARIEHAGEFRGDLEANWMPFTSVQHFSAGPPAFVWDARIRMAPLVSVHVRDSYIDGVGSMQGRLAALIPVIDQQGSPELASGALHRYLGEAVWFPTALLPACGVVWEAIDDATARATLSDAGTTVSIDFHFDAQGDIVRASADRYRAVDGQGVLTPWVVRLHRHRLVAGMRVPLEGEVEWLLPEGPLVYWRGTIESLEYDGGRYNPSLARSRWTATQSAVRHAPAPSRHDRGEGRGHRGQTIGAVSCSCHATSPNRSCRSHAWRSIL